MQNNFGQKNEVCDYRLLIINCRLNTVCRERWKKGVSCAGRKATNVRPVDQRWLVRWIIVERKTGIVTLTNKTSEDRKKTGGTIKDREEENGSVKVKKRKETKTN